MTLVDIHVRLDIDDDFKLTIENQERLISTVLSQIEGLPPPVSEIGMVTLSIINQAYCAYAGCKTAVYCYNADGKHYCMKHYFEEEEKKRGIARLEGKVGPNATICSSYGCREPRAEGKTMCTYHENTRPTCYRAYCTNPPVGNSGYCEAHRGSR